MSSGRLTYLSLPLFVCAALATAGCAAPPLVVGASYAADGGLLAASNKTSTDHLLSMVSKKDCAMWRVIRSRPVCTEREEGDDPYAVDYAQPQRMVAEDGVHYTAPLRSSANAPPTSWDPAAYATAPAPAPAVVQPAAVLPPAVADPAPITPQAAKPAAPVKKAKPIKKASRGRAASGS
jgi:hypothetical protein